MDKKQKPVILFVDDVEETLDSKKDLLEARGFLVLPYSSGRQVINDLENGLMYDVALVDLSLGDISISGYEVICELKRFYPRKAVICVSGYPYKPDEADAIFPKPIVSQGRIDDLVALINSYVERQGM